MRSRGRLKPKFKLKFKPTYRKSERDVPERERGRGSGRK